MIGRGPHGPLLEQFVGAAACLRIVLDDDVLVGIGCTGCSCRRVACGKGFDIGLLDRVDLLFLARGGHATGILTTLAGTLPLAVSIAIERAMAS